MPDAAGQFKGTGWSRASEDAYARVFGSPPLDAAVQVLRAAASVLDDPCRCQGDPPTYEYRKDRRHHCMWCDGLSVPTQRADEVPRRRIYAPMADAATDLQAARDGYNPNW